MNLRYIFEVEDSVMESMRKKSDSSQDESQISNLSNWLGNGIS